MKELIYSYKCNCYICLRTNRTGLTCKGKHKRVSASGSRRLDATLIYSTLLSNSLLDFLTVELFYLLRNILQPIFSCEKNKQKF